MLVIRISTGIHEKSGVQKPHLWHPQPLPGTHCRAGAYNQGPRLNPVSQMASTLSEHFLTGKHLDDACNNALTMANMAREYANNALRVAERAVVAVQKAESRLAKCAAAKEAWMASRG